MSVWHVCASVHAGAEMQKRFQSNLSDVCGGRVVSSLQVTSMGVLYVSRRAVSDATWALISNRARARTKFEDGALEDGEIVDSQ